MKLFTPYEATRTLPLVKRVVADILERGRELRRFYQRTDLTVEEDDRARVLAAELDELHEELELVGCSFRSPDFTFGLVDFPAMIEGKPVHLCWRDDEPELRWFHEPNAGFSGRRPIPEHLLAAPAPVAK